MGSQHRLRQRACLLLGLVLLAASATGACSNAVRDEKRKLLLAPSEDLAKRKQEAWEKIRVKNDDGALLPSDTKIAGVRLPRGLTQSFAREHEWYFDCSFSVEQLNQYFRSQLEVGAVHSPSNGILEYAAVSPKDSPDHPITVSMFPVPASPGRSRVRIREPLPPMQNVYTPEQVQQQMQARQRVAQ